MRFKVLLMISILLFGLIVAVASVRSYNELGAFTSENSGAIELESPYFETANVYKGQLHCHTKKSDGAQWPLEVVTAYKNAGYDFIAITDHDYVTPDPGVEGILCITGSEVSSTLGHMTTINVPSVPPSFDAQEVIDWTKAQGGLVWLAHPNWNNDYWTIEKIVKLRDYNGIEVYTHFSNSQPEVKWDHALTDLDRKITAIAVDDCHNFTNPNPFNGGWVMVFADTLTKAEILNSLEKGNFYSTQGPTINAIEVERNAISIKLNQISTVTWIGAGGFILQETTGVKEDTYLIGGNEKYVRIRVESSGYAWTNPIYVPELTVHSASVSDSRVNPAQLLTFSGQVYYENTTIPPANGELIQAYVALNGENKTELSEIETDGSFTFPSVPAENAVGLYNYNVYTVWNGQRIAKSQTVPVIVDGLAVSTYTTNLLNDQVQVRLLRVYDDTVVQNGNVTYAGLFALTDADGWATFNLSSLSTVDWGLTAYAISEPTYDLTAKFHNQTIGYAKTTIATLIIKAGNQISDVVWNFFEHKLSFNSSGTININVGDVGKPMFIEVDGATYADWTYDSTSRQVTVHNAHSRIVLQWDSYGAELWIVAAFSGGLAIITIAFFYKKR